MDEKNKSEEHVPFAKRWFVRAVFAIVGGGSFYAGDAVFDKFMVDKPLYDTFQTREEGRALQAAVKEVKETISASHTLQAVELGRLRDGISDLRNYMDTLRAQRDRELGEINAKLTENRLDIANIKLILNIKTKTN